MCNRTRQNVCLINCLYNIVVLGTEIKQIKTFSRFIWEYYIGFHGNGISCLFLSTCISLTENQQFYLDKIIIIHFIEYWICRIYQTLDISSQCFVYYSYSNYYKFWHFEYLSDTYLNINNNLTICAHSRYENFYHQNFKQKLLCKWRIHFLDL